MQIKGIIFDMDGLMFDTERIGYNLMFDIVKSFGYILPTEILNQTIGVNRKTAINIFEKYYGIGFPAEEILSIKRNIVDKYLKDKGIPLKMGLVNLLDYLDKQHIKKVVATSSYRKVTEMILLQTNLINRFDDIVCGDEIKESKPAPDIFLKALNKLNLSAKNVLVLEDSRMGILAAYQAGIKSIMIPDILPADEHSKNLYFKEFQNLNDVKLFLQTINNN